LLKCSETAKLGKPEYLINRSSARFGSACFMTLYDSFTVDCSIVRKSLSCQD